VGNERKAFVHAATVELGDPADPAAIGAAITAELCGHWEHPIGCRWPHNTSVHGVDRGVANIRTVFVARPGDEAQVRSGIARAVRSGLLEHDGLTHAWTVVREGPSTPLPDELELADRIGSTPEP
jgi:hypothetical protein